MYDVLKLVGGGLLALICTYVGLLVKRRYVSREKFYGNLCDFIAYARSELTSKMTAVPEICLSFAIENTDDLSTMLREHAEGLRRGKTGASRPSYLKDDELQELNSFLSGLGKSSLNEQVAYMDERGEVFKKKRSVCADESKRLGGMYFKLLVLLGIALMIITA